MSTPVQVFGVGARRLLLILLTAASAAGAAGLLVSIVPDTFMPLVAVPFIFLFVLLFAWVSHSFWVATFGFLRLLLARRGGPSAAPPGPLGARTALVFPVYNEEPAHVAAAIVAMHRSLEETGCADAFDFHILSDTNDPEVWAAELEVWAGLARELAGRGRVYYRNRPHNAGRKAGNIAEFCRRAGGAYDYFVVLDADSVMTGATLVELVRRMNADPRIGLIQVPTLPVGRHSLFARAAQFGASVYGPVYTSGLIWWQGEDGNYYGHNAIVRMRAFTGCAGLPTLPGSQPFGGEILSHDFVEAALMRRAGWKIVMADDLGGSWEEVPPTLIDYAKRDRRWCQGNLQHLSILAARGLKWPSRAHLAMGAMAYLASPLWLLLLVVSGLGAVWRAQTPIDYFPENSPYPVWPVSHDAELLLLFAVTAGLLLMPKLYGLVLVLLNRRARRGHGGALAVTASVIAESVFSMLLAPVIMLFQSSFVVRALLRRAVVWTRQRRSDGQTDLVEALVTHGGHTLVGITVAVVTFTYAPGFFWWLAPVLAGLIFSVPVSVLSSRVELGRAARRLGLFLTPAETEPDPVLYQAKLAVAAPAAPAMPQRGNPVTRLLVDPALNALHMALLPPSRTSNELERHALRGLVLKLMTNGVDSLTREEQRRLLLDRDSVALLHRLFWTRKGGPSLAEAAWRAA